MNDNGDVAVQVMNVGPLEVTLHKAPELQISFLGVMFFCLVMLKGTLSLVTDLRFQAGVGYSFKLDLQESKLTTEADYWRNLANCLRTGSWAGRLKSSTKLQRLGHPFGHLSIDSQWY